MLPGITFGRTFRRPTVVDARTSEAEAYSKEMGAACRWTSEGSRGGA